MMNVVETKAEPLAASSIRRRVPSARVVALPTSASAFERAPARAWSYATVRGIERRAELAADDLRGAIAAAIAALLHRYSVQQEIVLDVSLLSHGERPRAGTFGAECGPGVRFAELTAQANRALASLASGDVAYRSNVALTFARFARLKPLSEVAPLDDHHDLHFIVVESGARLACLVAYDAAVFAPRVLSGMIEGLGELFRAASIDASYELSALPVFTRAQRALLEEAARGPASERDDAPAHERFAAIAREQPHALALRHRTTELSYGELERRANALAQRLLAAGAGPNRVVAVCLAPSVEVLVALLAVLKVGAIYVPIDPSHPAALIAAILDEVKPALALTASRWRALFAAETSCLCLDEQSEPSAAELPLPLVTLEQPCYVIYTSGTTGRPKGVVATHANLAHYLGVARRRYGFRSSDAFCSLARYTFSISFFELLSPLTSGASLTLLDREEVLTPASLSARLRDVTVLHAGPSLLASLIRSLDANGGADGAFPNVRHASSGGDHVPAPLLERMKHVFPEAEIFVIYGCTEISCMGTTYEVPRDRKVERTLVGRPFPDMAVLLLDAHGQPVPWGAVGEVYFAGKGLAKRYLERPELTSEKFVCIDGQRFYRTGDLGRFCGEGEIELLGRSDFQVQVRGIRVEVLGIEHTVVTAGLAKQCVVVPKRREDGEVELVAFVVEPRERELSAFRRALAAHLPEAMVPQALVALEALPTTHNGKVDRLRLMRDAEARSERGEGAPYVAPEGATERAVAAAFGAVLRRPRVGRDGDFFALGGDSLAAIVLTDAIANQLGRGISAALLFEHPTVAALAAAIDGDESTRAAPILLSRRDDLPALFMLLGVHLYRALAAELEGEYAVYGVYAASELDLLAGRAGCSVEQLAGEYVEMIRAAQPRGPYRLGGMSFGGIVAFEAARQLEAAGEEVEVLLLIDSVLPEGPFERARRAAESAWSGLFGAKRASNLLSTPTIVESSPYADGAVADLEEQRQRAYRLAARAYRRRARRYEGRTTLIVAGERLARDPRFDRLCGFGRLLSNLAVHTLPADHLALLAQPAVRELARGLLRDERKPGSRRCVVPRRPRASLTPAR